jgi:hypothetical protein
LLDVQNIIAHLIARGSSREEYYDAPSLVTADVEDDDNNIEGEGVKEAQTIEGEEGMLFF